MAEKKKTWFVSHPSGGIQHTPTFFNSIEVFAEKHPEITILYPHDSRGDVHHTKEMIAQANLMLVEMSIPSTGSGIEMGWANDAGKPIIAFHQGGSEPSPSVQFVTSDVHIYVTAKHIHDVLETLV